MLFILLLLFLPCAIVGAFVTAEDQDLTAFQTAFSFRPPSGVLHGRSDAVATDRSPSRVQAASSSGMPRRTDYAPAMTMLITSSLNRLPTKSRSLCPTPSSTVLIWPAVATCTSGFFGITCKTGDADTSSPARRRRGSVSRSNTARMAMAIPARCALPSVDLLREAYGHRRSFWGDLTAAETRRFYHELLPVSVYLEALGAQGRTAAGGDERPLGGGMSGGGLATVVEAVGGGRGGDCECIFGAAETLEEQARLASMARHAARLYVRERCKLPSRVLAHLYDGLRHLKNYGSFRVTGMTWEQLWEKYEKKIRAEDPTLEGEDLKTSICLRILEKSCCTSEVFNNLSGCSELNTLLPSSDGVTATNTGGSVSSATSAGDGVDCGDDFDLLEGLEIFPATRMPSTAATKSADGQASDDGVSELELAYAAERAAACAGALRLTRLVKPFPAEQDEPPSSDLTQSSGKKPSDPPLNGGGQVSGPTQSSGGQPPNPTQSSGGQPSNPTQSSGGQPSNPTQSSGERPSDPPQSSGEQPSDPTQNTGEQPSGLEQSGCDGGVVAGGSRLTRFVPLLRPERTEAKEQKRADQRLRKTLGKRKFRKRGGQSSAA